MKNRVRSNPGLPEVIAIETCPDAQQEHEQSKRQYAHTFCRTGTICVAPEFFYLPQTHSVAILLHETGHLMLGNNGHREVSANRMIEQKTGIKIIYKDSPWGDSLEWIPSHDVPKGREVLGL